MDATLPRAQQTPPADPGNEVPTTAAWQAADRARNLVASNVALLAVSATAALVVPLRFADSLEGSLASTVGVLAALPLAYALCMLLARAGWGWWSAGASLAVSATAALAVAYLQPGLLAFSGVVFLLAAVLIMGALYLPFQVAASLAALNTVGAAAAPRFLPEAGTTTIEVPYLFLGVNAFLFVAYAIVRQREMDRLHRTTRDLSRQRHRVEQLERSAQDLNARHEVEVADLHRLHQDQQAFLGAASHELRTPLTPILIQLSLLRGRDDAGLNPAQVRHLDIIERNLDRLGVLVGDLLDIARLGTGNAQLNPAPVDLADLVHDTVDSFEEPAHNKGLELQVAVQGPLPVTVDALRISQVLYNLLGNAIKYAPDGGHVRLVAHRDLEGVQVRVQDDGPGLGADQQERLFQPFSQVHGGDARRGTGLGLYISHGILTQHQGRIWVESDGPGTGSTFCFWLPQKPTDGTLASASALADASKAPQDGS